MKIKDKAIKFMEAVNKAETIFISSHIGVDCDNIGSVTALFGVLKGMNKDVYMLESDTMPDAYKFLPNINELRNQESIDFLPDLYVSLDSGDLNRLGPNVETFKKAKYKVVIDHHDTNPGYGDLNIIDPEMSSTCQLLYEIFEALDIEISSDVATSLFSGISTDTGRFLYDNVSPRTFEIAGKLIELGADRSLANFNLFMNRPLRKLEILKVGLDKAEFLLDGYLAITDISQKDLEDTGASVDDLDEIVAFIRDTEGVEVSAIIKEYGDNFYKVSLRSKTCVNVGKLAQDLGGGGHIRAAGASVYGNIEEIKEKIIAYVRENKC